MNRVIADDSGNIAYQLLPDIPIRAHGGANAAPAPGWTGEYDWVGYIPFEELPWAKNPKRHFIVTANNRVVPKGYKYHVNLLTIPYRAWRIEELLQSKKRFDMQDFMAFQGDRYCRPADTIIGFMAKMKPTEETKQALQMLRSWDCVLLPDSSAGTLYQVFMQKLLGRLFAFAEGLPRAAMVLDGWTFYYLPKLFHQIEQDGRSLIELNEDLRGMSWQEVIMTSLKEAWDFLRENQGTDPSKWEWRNLHKQTFIHNLGRKPPHDRTFNIPSVGIGGDGSTVFNAGVAYRSNFATNVGVSFRMILDFADFNRSVWVLPPGQSGHPGSPHYSDGIQPWLNVKYHPMLWNWDDIRDKQEGTLELLPG